ncbi:MAG TPA: heparinase II/III family protein, partial [Phycisphaerae bacterium]|nr:heparinase II/III family protein [Phycisphaerae bacterium]
FKPQAILYEGPGVAGYVSTWHDACEEVRELTLAYDQVFAGLKNDRELVMFLGGKAKQYKLDNPKTSWADIQRNIEQRILQDTLSNYAKIRSNYPRTEIANAIIHMVLGTPGHRAAADKIIDDLIEKGTAVDGVTGEKGLSGYGTIGPTSIANLLAQFDIIDPRWMETVLRKHPRLHECYRFHVDTWCLNHYYPTCGDAGSFGSRVDNYAGVTFLRLEDRLPTIFAGGPLAPSMYTFMYRMHKLTGDPAFAQIVYLANGRSVEGLPHDLFVKEPESIQKEIAAVVEREGATPKLGSVNKQEWHLAILRSGRGDHARAVWLDYDSSGGHRHQDGLNLGLYAYGLDLMPDFGYPPVQFGGWGSPRAVWYTSTAAHNTVVVDGKNQLVDNGRTILWGDGQTFRAIKAAEPGAYKIPVYERTVASIDIPDRDFYAVDVFRVRGGKDHAKFLGSHFSTITTQGLDLQPGAEYGHGSQLRNMRIDAKADPGWSVDFKVEDLHKYLSKPADIHLRHTDLTADAQAGVAEAWVVAGLYDSKEEQWVPRIMTRRTS